MQKEYYAIEYLFISFITGAFFILGLDFLLMLFR